MVAGRADFKFQADLTNQNIAPLVKVSFVEMLGAVHKRSRNFLVVFDTPSIMQNFDPTLPNFYQYTIVDSKLPNIARKLTHVSDIKPRSEKCLFHGYED